MSYAICTLLLKLSVLLPLLVVVYSGESGTESSGNLRKKEIKNTANVTFVSSVLQDATKNALLPRKDTVAIVEAPVDVFGRQELEKEGVTKMEKKRESRVVRSKEKVKSKLRETSKRKADSPEIEDGRNWRTVENFKYDKEDEDNSYDQDKEDVDANRNDKGHIFKSDIRNKEEDAKNDPWRDSEKGQSSDDEEEEFQRNVKRGGRHSRQGPKIWDQWGKWSSCSVSCGAGKLTRWRHCIAGGCSIGEKEAQLKTCTFAAC